MTYRHDAEDPIRRRRQRVARPAVLGREDLGRVRVQDRVHDVAGEAEGAVPAEERGRVESRGGGVEEDAGEDGGERECAAAAEARDFDEEAAEEGAGDAEDGDDERVAVGEVGGAVAEVGAARGLDVGEEGLEAG